MPKKPLSVGVKAALITASAAIIVALITLLRSTAPTNSQIADNSPGAIQAGRDVNILTPSQPNFIEETDVPKEQIQNSFPFGYAIIYFGQNKIERCEIITNGLMEWKLDVNQIKIEPDFFRGIVNWTLPNISGDSFGSEKGPKVNLSVGQMEMTSLLKKGAFSRSGFLIANKPNLYVGTLNDNQRMPVFLVGFRITSKDEINPEPK